LTLRESLEEGEEHFGGESCGSVAVVVGRGEFHNVKAADIWIEPGFVDPLCGVFRSPAVGIHCADAGGECGVDDIEVEGDEGVAVWPEVFW